MSFGDRTLLLKLALDTGNLEAGMRGATGRLGRIGSQLKGFGVALAANVAISAIDEVQDRIFGGIEDAQAYREAFDAIDQTWAAMGGDGAELAQRIDDINAETARLGFDDVETLRVWQRYLDLTGDADDATRLLGLTMDRARAENKDLNTAWSETTRLYRGGVRQIELLGLSVDEFGKNTASGMERAEAGLGRYEQAAESFAGTTAGRLESVGTQVDRLFATLGEEILKLADEWLPIFLDEMLPAVAEFWNGIQPFLQEVVGAIGEVIGAIMEAEDIWRPILDLMVDLVGKLAQAWLWMVRQVGPIIRRVSRFIRDLRRTMVSLWKRGEQVLDDLAAAWRSAFSRISGFIDWVLSPLQELQRLLQSLNIDPLGAIGDFVGGLPLIGGNAASGASSGASGQAAAGGNVYMTVHGDPRTVESAVVRAMGRRATRNGGIRVSNLNQHSVGLR